MNVVIRHQFCYRDAMTATYQTEILLWGGGDEESAAVRALALAAFGPAGLAVAEVAVLPPDRDAWASALAARTREGRAGLLLTVGGSGYPPGEVVPDLTAPHVSRPVPGIPEAIREAGCAFGPGAALFRGTAGLTKGGLLIINLPAEPDWLGASLALVARIAPHALDKASGDPRDCGR